MKKYSFILKSCSFFIGALIVLDAQTSLAQGACSSFFSAAKVYALSSELIAEHKNLDYVLTTLDAESQSNAIKDYIHAKIEQMLPSMLKYYENISELTTIENYLRVSKDDLVRATSTNDIDAVVDKLFYGRFLIRGPLGRWITLRSQISESRSHSEPFYQDIKTTFGIRLQGKLAEFFAGKFNSDVRWKLKTELLPFHALSSYLARFKPGSIRLMGLTAVTDFIHMPLNLGTMPIQVTRPFEVLESPPLSPLTRQFLKSLGVEASQLNTASDYSPYKDPTRPGSDQTLVLLRLVVHNLEALPAHLRTEATQRIKSRNIFKLTETGDLVLDTTNVSDLEVLFGSYNQPRLDLNKKYNEVYDKIVDLERNLIDDSWKQYSPIFEESPLTNPNLSREARETFVLLSSYADLTKSHLKEKFPDGSGPQKLQQIVEAGGSLPKEFLDATQDYFLYFSFVVQDILKLPAHERTLYFQKLQ